MGKAVASLAVALLALAAPTGAQELSVSGRDQLGCDTLRGDFIAYLVPHQGIALLANSPFPGGSPVGTVTDGRLTAIIPELGTVSLGSESPSGTEVWGMLDRSLEVGDRQGCFVFGGFGWSSVDDLKTYLHWGVREVLANIRYDVSMGEEPPTVKLAERRVTLEILTPDHRTLRIRGVEGTTLGYRPRDSDVRFFFQPFILEGTTAKAAVRVSTKKGDFFGPGTTDEVAFVVIYSDQATTLPTQPVIALRLVAIEDRVTFDDQ